MPWPVRENKWLIGEPIIDDFVLRMLIGGLPVKGAEYVFVKTGRYQRLWHVTFIANWNYGRVMRLFAAGCIFTTKLNPKWKPKSKDIPL